MYRLIIVQATVTLKSQHSWSWD